jgi:hypothetical protein
MYSDTIVLSGPEVMLSSSATSGTDPGGRRQVQRIPFPS